MSNSSCNFSEDSKMILGLSLVASNTIAILACLFVILVIVVYKKYIFTFQQLVLHLSTSILLHSVAHTIQGASYQLIQENEHYCQVLGFFDIYFPLCMVLSVLCVIIELYLYVLQKRDTTNLKWIYVAFIFVVPALVSWIPFAFKQYGYTGYYCSILYYDKDCRHDFTGLALLLMLWWMPLVLSLF